ncbi:hypothetical protein [Endozoicomonas euniceicola]|uniref:Uncharacterized protein n=1 Tax=Endozoicomonas euniceicola TaxID=1234143 RepID=A0ABY6H0N1_9GAMM|nr:hypothetical protein [Endozoicomonas euniceicola]UYM18620.1 hypothetical protein NX720_12200 [Endozoicomonas euniceicola]
MINVTNFFISTLLFVLLFSFLSEAKSAETEKNDFPVVINDNPAGVAVTYKTVSNAQKTSTHIFLGQHYEHIPQQLWDVISTSVTTASLVFSPYLYAAASGGVANRIQAWRPESRLPSALRSSVPVVGSTISLLTTVALFNTVAHVFAGKIKDDKAVLDKQTACERHKKRNGIMPVYPQNSWLGRHFHQRVLFTEEYKPVLEINRLASPGWLSDDGESKAVSEWVDLYKTLSRHQVNKVTVQPDDKGLKLTFDDNVTFRKVSIIVSTFDESGISWDIDRQHYCSVFEGSGIYSIFHQNTVKAIAQAIEQAISFNNDVFFLSPNKSNFTMNDAGAAVVQLDHHKESSCVVYSDRDFYAKNAGYFLIAEPGHKAQSLFKLALNMESDSLARQYSSQIVWGQEDINYLIYVLKFITTVSLCRGIYNNLNTLCGKDGFFSESVEPDKFALNENIIKHRKAANTGLSKKISYRLQAPLVKMKKEMHTLFYPVHKAVISTYSTFMVDPDENLETTFRPEEGGGAQVSSDQKRKKNDDALKRAEKKFKSMLSALTGIFDGSLAVGSREPVKGMPFWVTPVVLKGGIASREYAAGGELTDYERSLLEELSIDVTDNTPEAVEKNRKLLNSMWLTNESYIATLNRMLETGHYRIQYPEQGMHLLIRNLISMGEKEKADDLISLITPFFDKIRFFPEPAESPVNMGDSFSFYTVDWMKGFFKKMKDVFEDPRSNSDRLIYEQILSEKMKNNADDRLSLLMETIEGEPPYLDDSKLCGGFPCRLFPEGWFERAKENMAEKGRLLDIAKEKQLKIFTRKRGSNLHILKIMQSILDKNVDEIAVKKLRKIMAEVNRKRGLPGSERYDDYKKRRKEGLDKHLEVDKALSLFIDELERFPNDRGLDSVHVDYMVGLFKYFEVDKPLKVTADKSLAESGKKPLQLGKNVAEESENIDSPLKDEQLLFKRVSLLPQRMVLKTISNLKRLQTATLEEHLKAGRIKSAKQMSELSKHLIYVENDNIPDAGLRAVDGQLRKAFRNRRSLLLRGLQSQVEEDEMPWRKIIDTFENKESSPDSDANAHPSVLQAESDEARAVHLVKLSVNYFPYSILPNPLIGSIQKLVKSRTTTKELAADIFEKTFSVTFLTAAKYAAEQMSGTLYAKYYSIPYNEILKYTASADSAYGHKPISEELYNLCFKLSCLSQKPEGSAGNGMIIEWQQIITTHNLAPFYDDILRSDNNEQHSKKRITDTAEWIVNEITKVYKVDYHLDKDNPAHYPERLRRRKNIAYAFRQLIFYLSFEEKSFQLEALSMLKEIPDRLDKLHTGHKGKLLWDDSLTDGSSNPSLSGSIKRQVKHIKIEVEQMLQGLELTIHGLPNPHRPFLGWLSRQERNQEVYRSNREAAAIKAEEAIKAENERVASVGRLP